MGAPAAWASAGSPGLHLVPPQFPFPKGGKLPSLSLRTLGGAAWDQEVGLSRGGSRQRMLQVWVQLCSGPVLTCGRLSAPVGAAWTSWGRKAWGLPAGLRSAAQHPPLPPSELEPALLMVNTVWMLEAGLLRKFLCVLHTRVQVHRCPQCGPCS